MSKTNDTSKLNHAILENREVVVVADGDLDAVTGGTKARGSGTWFEALAQAWGNALDAKAASL